ncbi:hypothetical protein CLOM_g15412 [Closterium sp. NIES-68]|nr:hypothetical protein CLOM_g15412 [Closterium sp. NIES-68]GJP84646.1 hypothetical protein CLOP_g14696 [Closterium sp. NIES-67]
MAMDGGVSARDDRIGLGAGESEGGKAGAASDEGGGQQALSGSPLEGPVWVEARGSCAHIHDMAFLRDLPPFHALCNQCGCAADNWVCLTCGEVACGRAEGAHMVKHFHATGHPVAAGFRDSSVWCFQCDSYLDALRIPSLRPLFHSLYRSKSGQYLDLPLHSHAHSPTSAPASAAAPFS